ncbi:FKBP12-associated protein [Diplodia intermedia]|uniref:FKBP12-associated protein n=1 Tax=Diplodia intermedia TaxID=856260 RepID=A0ABR3TLR3_9PEZI
MPELLHNKQEAKCLATKDSEGSLKKSLKCDDECARLERNRKLALALNVDPEAHTDDHIPYSAETLSLYQQNVQWAQTQEREFRVLATSPEEKRLRFKPMPSQQRAFIHALAEDFGLDSESMDPEPHRHVVIYKTPRFVSAPTKTVGECVRIRYNQRAATTTVPITATDAAKKLKASNVVGDPYNGFLLSTPRFALTIEELRTAIRPVTDSTPMVHLDISFLPNDEVVLKANATLSERDLEATLKNIKAGLAREVRSHSLGSIQLCRVDASLNILRREMDSAANGGWSQVAAKAAAPTRMRPQPSARVGSNSFTVLSLSNKSKESRDKEKNKKKAVEEAVEDWEAAEAMEEEKERLESGDASKVASGAATEDEAETTKTEADKDPRVETSGAGELAVSPGNGVEVEDEGVAPV